MTSDPTDSSEAPQPERPNNYDPAAWRAYWQALDQGWRTEPEIDEERKEELARRRAIRPDPDRDEYPFKGVELSRGDVEWLLETHEGGRGPVNLTPSVMSVFNLTMEEIREKIRQGENIPTDAELRQRERLRQGLELRGATLHTDLSYLPLASTLLGGANFSKARLEGAKLWQAHLEGAYFVGAHLEGANLSEAHLQGANLSETHLQGANLRGTRLESKKMNPDADDLNRLRRWNRHFPDMLWPTDLRRAFFDVHTDLSKVSLSGTARA